MAVETDEMQEEVNTTPLQAQEDQQRTAIQGIIYPPPEVRTIIDKTASFAAKHGDKFEERIKEKEANNPKFNFLLPTDPYNAYYKFKVKDFREGKAQEKKIEDGKKEVPTSAKKIPKEPPPFEFITEMPPISAQDLDILKLTAQFVARNGRQFLTGLSQRESRNYQFDFLRPNHSLFPYFTKLVEQYTKVLIPPKTLKEVLQVNATDKPKLLQRAMERCEWTVYQEVEKKKAEDEAEKERIAYASIDWHDFVVIGTIEFTGDEDASDLPPPVTRESLQIRTLVEKKTSSVIPRQPERIQEEEMEMDTEMDTEMEIEESDASMGQVQLQNQTQTQAQNQNQPQNVPPPQLQHLGPIKIKKDYVPKSALGPKTKEETVVFKGVEIPVSEIKQHMKIELLDPKWKEQREMSLQKNKDTNLASDEDIGLYLQSFAKYRTDIFGNEEVGIGKKIENPSNPNSTLNANLKQIKETGAWDGRSSSISAATKAAQQGASIEEKLNAVLPSKALSEADFHGPQMPDGAPRQNPNFLQFPGSTSQPQSSISISMPSNPTPTQTSIPQPTLRPPVPFNPLSMPQNPLQPPLHVLHPLNPNYNPALNPPGVPGAPGVPGLSNELEPATKKQKIEDNGLIPEDEYLLANKGSISLRIEIPKSEVEVSEADKNVWKLHGQTESVTLSIEENIGKLKEKIHELIGMPASRMNLRLSKGPVQGFLRDQHSLAYYNLNSASIIILERKERGRKKGN